MRSHPLHRRALRAALWCASVLSLPPASAQPTAAPLPERRPFYLMPSVEGLYACEEGLAAPGLKNLDAVNDFCIRRGKSGADGIARLLEQLEPGGARGQVQVGYVATLQLLALYHRVGREWRIDEKRLDAFVHLLTHVKRPVVVYLAANQFDSQGPIVDELVADARNLVLLGDGKPPTSNYFGYRIVPYTLRTDEALPVNRYRFAALRHVARRLQALPGAVRERIIAITLAGEVHQLFEDFENGMGRYDGLRVSDYSPASVADFRAWLARRYGSIAAFNQRLGFDYADFSQVPAPAKDIRKERLASFGEHYDGYADGSLPVTGWLWDPRRQVEQLDVYLDGKALGPVGRGFNRLDVYRADAAVTDPNVGYRRDLDFSTLSPGRHLVQVVARANGRTYLAGQAPFVVVPRDQRPTGDATPAGLAGLRPIKELDGVKTWLDMPRSLLDVYFNPLARDWNLFRSEQVRHFMDKFHAVARQAGLPADKLYSHQILPEANASWNTKLFATDRMLTPDAPWKKGLNLYGGATAGTWLETQTKQNQWTDYGVPEFNPQQWKRKGAQLEALKAHYLAGARFVSPYYMTPVPDRFKGDAQHGVNAMELRPDNPRDGSDQFYRALQEFARH